MATIGDRSHTIDSTWRRSRFLTTMVAASGLSVTNKGCAGHRDVCTTTRRPTFFSGFVGSL